MDDETALRLEAADRAKRARDFIQSDGLQPMTAGWAKYRKNEPKVIVSDDQGKQHWLTMTQHTICIFIRAHEGETITATVIANSLGVAVSTVTRALTRLAALRLIAFNIIRGRNGGIEILARAWADLKRRSRTAWDLIREQGRKAEQRWFRRLEESHYFIAGLNFASIGEGERKIYGDGS